MAVYNLEIPYFVVNNPRSGGLLGDEDTLFATTGLVVNDAQGGIYQQYGGKTMELRDRGQGSIVSTGLRYAGVDVPDGGKIHWTFTLMNTGHGDIAFIGALTNLSDQFSRALAANTINGQEADNAGTNVLQYLGNFPFLDAVVQAVLNKLVNICDGVVVDAVIERTAAQLADMTAANGIWEDKRNHPGGDSPPGCGGNSNYDVVYGISLRDAALPWSGEEDLGGILTSAPAVASWGLNRLDCFARGLNNHMWHRSWGGNGWTNWEDLGGILTSSPAVASWGLNRLDCFYRGQNNHLWHRWYDGHWSNEQDLGGFLNSDPAVASWEPNRLDIFYKGPNNTMLHRWWDGHAWNNGDDDLGGNLVSGPAVASWGPNRLDCFYVGPGNTMWHRAYDGGWKDEEDLGGGLIDRPAAASWGPNRLDCFYTGPQFTMVHRWWDGNAWSGEEDLGGALAAGPAVASWGPPGPPWAPGRLDCFYRGDNDHMLHRWFPNW